MPDHGPRLLNPHKKSWGRISRDWNDDCFIDSLQKCLFHKNRWWQYKLKKVKSFPFREVTSVGKFCQAFRVSLLWFVERWNPAHEQKCIFNCQLYIRHHLDPNVLRFLDVILPRQDDWMFNIYCNGQFIINLEWQPEPCWRPHAPPPNHRRWLQMTSQMLVSNDLLTSSLRSGDEAGTCCPSLFMSMVVPWLLGFYVQHSHTVISWGLHTHYKHKHSKQKIQCCKTQFHHEGDTALQGMKPTLQCAMHINSRVNIKDLRQNWQ